MRGSLLLRAFNLTNQFPQLSLGFSRGLLCSSFWGLLCCFGKGLRHTTQKGTALEVLGRV